MRSYTKSKAYDEDDRRIPSCAGNVPIFEGIIAVEALIVLPRNVSRKYIKEKANSRAGMNPFLSNP